MMWSKLQKQLYLIIDKSTNFQIHCSVYKTKSAWNAGQHNGISNKQEMIPRYWITAGNNNEVIWDFPNNYLTSESQTNLENATIQDTYFWDTNYKWVAETIRYYLDTPRDKLLISKYEKDKYGLTDVLRKYDRRISKLKRKML